MLAMIIALVGQAAIVASTPVNPNANALFDRDVVLKQWAVRTYDSNRDGWLTLYEAQGALAAFKDLADGDRMQPDNRFLRKSWIITKALSNVLQVSRLMAGALEQMPEHTGQQCP